MNCLESLDGLLPNITSLFVLKPKLYKLYKSQELNNNLKIGFTSKNLCPPFPSGK